MSKRIGPYSQHIIAAARAVLTQRPEGLTLLELTAAIQRKDLPANAYEVGAAVKKSHYIVLTEDLKYKLKT